MSKRPSLFIGSSWEGIELAQAVRGALGEVAEVKVWNEGTLALGQNHLDSLIETSRRFDFAVLILTPGDRPITRSTVPSSPAESVIFQLGLFIGRIGRQRTFVVCPSDNFMQLPPDLVISVHIPYATRYDGDLHASVEAACDEIRYQIRERGFKGEDEEALAGLPGWGRLRGDLADGALFIKDPKLYVQSPSAARTELLHQIEAGAVIPSRYHYSSDMLADQWIRRCEEESYTHQRNTLGFWGSPAGRGFAERAWHSLDSTSFDFVSLGPGDGEKDAALIESWLRAGADLLYYPYDVSFPLVARAVDRVRKTAASIGKKDALRVKAVLADFRDLETVRAVFQHRDKPNMVALLGTLGNLPSENSILQDLRATMGMEDRLMLEVRLWCKVDPESERERLTKGSSLEQDFGPLHEYFGLEYSRESVWASFANGMSDIPGTRTLMTTYRGVVPGLADEQEVKLQYIHLYSQTAFKEFVENEGFAVVDWRPVEDMDPPFLECTLSRRK